MSAPVTIREGGKTKTVTKGEAFAKAVLNDAINGKPAALRYFQQRVPEEALAEAAEQDTEALEEARERILGRIDDYIERDEKEREGHRNELRQHGVSEDDTDALVGMDDEGKEERRQKVAQKCKERGVPAGLIKRVLDSRLK
jgi:SOS response regulatory protein OraA/RecX